MVSIFGGSLTGLVGTYLALVMVLLVSRIPFVERVLGQDGLLRWHRWLAPWPIGLLITHALLITIGYARAARTGAWHTVGVLIVQYPDILTATVALGLMCLAGAISVRAVRRRLPRERWWVVHLYLYLALAISFAHVIVLGPSFVGHPLTQFVWSAAWLPTAGLVLSYQSCCRSFAACGTGCVSSRCARRVPASPRSSSAAVASTGWRICGGQFFLWRFFSPDLWWQAHPYSLLGAAKAAVPAADSQERR